MATLLAEDGLPVTAGLPEEMRRDLERLDAARKRMERARARRAHLDQLIARAIEFETRIKETEKELEEVLREYSAQRAALVADDVAA